MLAAKMIQSRTRMTASAWLNAILSTSCLMTLSSSLEECVQEMFTGRLNLFVVVPPPSLHTCPHNLTVMHEILAGLLAFRDSESL
jgi:hypothetical protein